MLEVARFISKKQVRELTSLSPASIDRWERKGQFPSRHVLSLDKHGKPARVAWRLADVLSWLQEMAIDSAPTP
jgi:predicted DNA-binding transcriptional regulator AlpA